MTDVRMGDVTGAINILVANNDRPTQCPTFRFSRHLGAGAECECVRRDGGIVWATFHLIVNVFDWLFLGIFCDERNVRFDSILMFLQPFRDVFRVFRFFNLEFF